MAYRAFCTIRESRFGAGSSFSVELLLGVTEGSLGNLGVAVTASTAGEGIVAFGIAGRGGMI